MKIGDKVKITDKAYKEVSVILGRYSKAAVFTVESISYWNTHIWFEETGTKAFFKLWFEVVENEPI